VTILLDMGVAHCSISTCLATALGLLPSGQQGQLSLAAAAGCSLGLGAQVLLNLCLADTFSKSVSISPMVRDVGDNLILGWDWISSHDLLHLYQTGQVELRSGLAQLQPNSRLWHARPRRPGQGVAARAVPALDSHFAGGGGPPGRHGAAPCFCLADADLTLKGTDDPAFAAPRAGYADVLGGAPPGLQPARGVELVIDTGDAPMQRSRPVKRLSRGELAELRTQLVDRDLLDRWWVDPALDGWERGGRGGGVRTEA
jgi:hypothetical protein